MKDIKEMDEEEIDIRIEELNWVLGITLNNRIVIVNRVASLLKQREFLERMDDLSNRY